MFGRINELLIISIFKDHILLIFMQKMAPGKQVRIIEVQLYLTPLFTFHNFAETFFPMILLGIIVVPREID